MKRWTLAAALMLFLSTHLLASPYAKVGSEPSLGLGLRQSIGHHGCDLSINAAPLYDERRYCAKSLYLFYPKPESQARLYFGGGVGGTIREQSFPNYKVWKHAKKERSFESVAGYEFLYKNRMKMYAQAECSVPQSKKPEVRCSVGFGF